MIKPGEISKVANELKLRDTQIEKDYVIGWILKGISNINYLKENLIFKGGTAIRKLYINDYRLSEDMDFSIKENSMDSKRIKNEFENMIKWVEENSNINLEIQDEATNKSGNYSFYLYYTGPLGGSKNSIKVDISDNERIYNEPEYKRILDNYSDTEGCYEINCYSINEIIAEKLRSLMQRTAPRDLYDIWYLLEKERYEITEYIPDFKEKAKYKNLNPKCLLEVLKEKEEKFKKAWKGQLENQINNVPDFEAVWRTLKKHFKKFHKEFEND